ncbi:ABC transporter permease subunit [Puniceicoccaceae bacterium K14]|nr:ABC transporter permease subunit [Puniceicoccaceae bacterium K14]
MNRLALGLLLWASVSFFWLPYDPYEQGHSSQSGMWHLMGLDELGQDVFSRVWLGTANSFFYSFGASFVSLLLASILLVAEQASPRIVRLCIRSLVSIGIALPVIFLGLLLMVFLPPSPLVVSMAIAISTIPFAFRQVRVLWLEQSSADHVLASRNSGAGKWHMFHFALWPNLAPQFFEIWKIVLGVSILEMSALTFLGLAGDPNWAELGSLLRYHQKFLLNQPWLVVWPGVFLCSILLITRRVSYPDKLS